jgi:integrase
LRTTDLKAATRSGPAVVEQIKLEFDHELEVLARGQVPELVRRHVPTEHEIEERLFSILKADLSDDQFARSRCLDKVRGRNVERLFPELKMNTRGRSSSTAGTWWRKYLQKHGISGNAYRFRHTFADALREAGGLDAEIGSLLGHSGGSMTEHYGNVSQVTLARRAALVNAVSFEAVHALKPRHA